MKTMDKPLIPIPAGGLDYPLNIGIKPSLTQGLRWPTVFVPNAGWCEQAGLLQHEYGQFVWQLAGPDPERDHKEGMVWIHYALTACAN